MNRYVRPVMFAFEPDLVFLFAKISFGAAGAPTLVQPNSKGFCNVTLNTLSFTGTTDGSTAVLTAISSFVGLYVGMTVVGVGIPANSTILSMNAGAGTVTLSANTTGAHVAEAMTATGGQYLVQLGQQAGVRLDTYTHFLGLSHSWDEAGLQGAVSTAASSPAAPEMFLTNINTGVRTIPGTAATALTDASFTVQFGRRISDVFTAENPANGEIVRLMLKMSRSSAQ